VVDGNYSAVRDLVWARADTVVWFDLPRRTVMWQVVGRTLGRVLTRTELWNGNREQLRFLFTPYWIPWWVLRMHRHYSREIPGRVAEHPHLTVVTLRSDEEFEAFLQSIQATDPMSGSSNGSDRQKTPPLTET
jgi:hypothetical protein